MKKILAMVLSGTLLLTGLAGCGGKEVGKNTSDKIELTVGNWPKDDEEATQAQYEGYLKTMNEKYPNITIVKDQWCYDVNSFLPKAASGQLPTLYNTFFTEITKIVDAGYAADITEAMKKYQYDTSINKQFIDLASSDGKIYGVPVTGYLTGLACNVKLFKEAGLVDENGTPKFPQTYEELAQTAKTIKDKTGKPGFFMATKNNQGGWHFMNIAWSFGVKFEEKKGDKWTSAFNSKEMIDAVTYVKDLKWKYGVMIDDALVDASEFDKLFSTNQVGMGICAPGSPANFRGMINNYKADKNNISMAQLPEGPGGRKALIGGVFEMFSTGATPEQIDAGFKWLEVIGLSPKVTDDVKKTWEGQYKLDNENGYVVGCDELSVWTNPERAKIQEEARAPYINVDTKLFADYKNLNKVSMQPEEPVCVQELYKILDSVIQEILINKDADPKALVEKASNDFQTNFLDKVN